MHPIALVAFHLVKVATLVALLGLIVHRAYRLCWPLVAYLSATLFANLLITLWRETFYTYSFWVIKETVYVVLQFAIALEIARRTFQVFPGARAAARRYSLLIVSAAVIAFFSFPAASGTTPPAWSLQLVSQWHARLLAATTGLFATISVLVTWYKVPISTFLRRILMGFTAWLVVIAINGNILGAIGWSARDWCNLVVSLSSLALIAWCALAAWRHEEETLLSPEASTCLGAFRHGIGELR